MKYLLTFLLISLCSLQVSAEENAPLLEVSINPDILVKSDTMFSGDNTDLKQKNDNSGKSEPAQSNDIETVKGILGESEISLGQRESFNPRVE